jgi:hypothetical protein
MGIQFETGNDTIGTVQWRVEIDDATRWQLHGANCMRAIPDPEHQNGYQTIADSHELWEIILNAGGGTSATARQTAQAGTGAGLSNDNGSPIRGLSHIHLDEAAGYIATWVCLGIRPEEQAEQGGDTAPLADESG